MLDERGKQELFLVILEAQAGNITQACIASGICRTTFYRWREDFEWFAAREVEVRETVVDFAESKLMENIGENSSRDIQFFLNAQGKARGYGQVSRVELSGPGGGAIPLASPSYPPEPETLAEWEAQVRNSKGSASAPNSGAREPLQIAEHAGAK